MMHARSRHFFTTAHSTLSAGFRVLVVPPSLCLSSQIQDKLARVTCLSCHAVRAVDRDSLPHRPKKAAAELVRDYVSNTAPTHLSFLLSLTISLESSCHLYVLRFHTTPFTFFIPLPLILSTPAPAQENLGKLWCPDCATVKCRTAAATAAHPSSSSSSSTNPNMTSEHGIYAVLSALQRDAPALERQSAEQQRRATVLRAHASHAKAEVPSPLRRFPIARFRFRPNAFLILICVRVSGSLFVSSVSVEVVVDLGCAVCVFSLAFLYALMCGRLLLGPSASQSMIFHLLIFLSCLHRRTK
jgi:hypothetical protein